ncbi:glycosyltransferase family 4 protein [Paraburkholderia caffeinilytica]|uniref:glycosyltransferase family 4 protein n=1 Tax=Paraburkholderia caffeinilytica TaxID=1761016 RepID=UPI0038BC31FD
MLSTHLIDFDNIIFNIQRFGGASTYWRELTARVTTSLPGEVVFSTGTVRSRLVRPKSAARIFHSSHFRVSRSKQTQNVVTIHDLIYEKRMVGGIGAAVNLFERRRAVINADAIICISESTKRDMLEYYGRHVATKPVCVIHHGCDNFSAAGAASIEGTAPSPRGGQSPYFIYAGGRTGYKNFDVALRAFAAGGFAARGIQLICTGAAFSASEMTLIQSLRLESSVKAIGTVTSAALGGLYGGALALLYPSSYEGFGLPPLEAMASGCPVICSASSSLPEVVGDAGLLAEASSVDSFEDAMRRFTDENVRAEFIERGYARAAIFTWDKSAENHMRFYKTLA